ncbi:MAG: helix-turn-helix domain-containing protein [Syntrophales bacterium]|jgi:excisionase family DNA binding protein
MKDQPDKYITVQKVAERLDCSVRHIYNLMQEGYFVIIKIGKDKGVRISEKSVNAFIESKVIDPSDYYSPDSDKPKPVKTVQSHFVGRR